MEQGFHEVRKEKKKKGDHGRSGAGRGLLFKLLERRASIHTRQRLRGGTRAPGAVSSAAAAALPLPPFSAPVPAGVFGRPA